MRTRKPKAKLKPKPSKPISTSTKIEPAPKKGTAQLLLYSLQQLTFALLDRPHTLVKPLSMEEGVKVAGGASLNYKRMGRFASMIFHWLVADRANYLKFRQQTLNFLRDERVTGHMGTEQGCSQPHDGMHLSATFLAHLFAHKTADNELIKETEWWISSYLAICQACYSPIYPRVLMPGFRIKDDPISENRDIIYQHLVLNRSLDKVQTPSKGWISWQRFYLPALLAIELKARKITPLPALSLPALYAPLAIKRTPSSLHLEINVPISTSGKSQTVEWIDIDDGKPSYCRRDGIITHMDRDPDPGPKET